MVSGLSKAITSLTDKLNSFTDLFDNQVSRGTQNKADLPSDKPASPERYRLFQNGGTEADRLFFQYGEGSGVFTDTPDSYNLEPGGGDTLLFRTAERYRYVVGYASEWSQALSLSRSLEPGEWVEVQLDAMGDGADGHGLHHDPGTTYIYERRNGAPNQGMAAEAAAREVSLPHVTRFGDASPGPLIDLSRIESRYTWYNVGPAKFRQSFSRQGIQYNDEVGSVSASPGEGSRYSLGHISIRVHRATGTDPLTVSVGSSGVNIRGDVTATSRVKAAILSGLSHSGSGALEPLAAFRIKRDYPTVTSQFNRALPISGPDGYLELIAVSPAKTDAGETSGWSSQGISSAIELTTDVSTFPDSTGTPVTSAVPMMEGGVGAGGWQLALGSSTVTGSGGNQQQSSTSRVRKRPLLYDDVGVLLGYAEAAGDFEVEGDTDQEW